MCLLSISSGAIQLPATRRAIFLPVVPVYRRCRSESSIGAGLRARIIRIQTRSRTVVEFEMASAGDAPTGSCGLHRLASKWQ